MMLLDLLSIPAQKLGFQVSRTNQDRFQITDNKSELLNEWLEDSIHDIHTAIPCIVTGFDADKSSVNVRVAVKRDIRGQIVNVAELFGVPVSYNCTKDFGVYFPISQGDTGLIVFCEASIDRWVTSEDGTVIVNAQDQRMHDYSDGVFIPGTRSYNRGDPISDDAQVKYKNCEINLLEDGSINIKNNSGEISISNSGEIDIKSDGKWVFTSGSDFDIISKNLDVDCDKIKINTNLGSLFSKIADAIQKADHTGAASADIALIRQMTD